MIQITRSILGGGLTHRRHNAFVKYFAAKLLSLPLFTRGEPCQGKTKFILALSLALCFSFLPERAHADCQTPVPNSYAGCSSEAEAEGWLSANFDIICPGATPIKWDSVVADSRGYCPYGDPHSGTVFLAGSNDCGWLPAAWCEPNSCVPGTTQNCFNYVGYCPSATQQTCSSDGYWGPCQCPCDDGYTKPCTATGTAGYACSGTQTCSGNVWGACQPGPDCNQCTPEGATQACTTGCPIGGGKQTCSGGQWGGCVCSQCQTADCGNKCNGPDCNTTCVGSSANLKSGNLTHNQDVITAPKSLPFALTYNSNDPTIGPFGQGWTHTYHLLISAATGTPGSALIFTENDGNNIKFTASGSVYIPDASSGDTSTIALNADGTYTRTLKDGTLQTFDATGILTSIKDRNGNTTTLSYSGGNLATITDSTGRSLNITTSSGQIASITDPAGNIYSFTYSGNLLTAVTDPAGNSWNYTYDASGRMLTKKDPAGFQTTYTHTNGMLASATDSNGQVKTLSYNSAGSTTQYVEKDGGVWNQTYDPNLNLPLTKTDPTGGVTRYTYDSKGNMLTQTDPNGGVTTFAYDANSNVTSITDPLNHTTAYTYNTFSEILTMTDPLGNVTTYTYDTNGNLLSATDPLGAVTTYQYDSKGNRTNITNALGKTTSLTYDQYNNIASITDATGAKSTFTYDMNGNRTSRIDANGNTTTFAYNNLNRLIQVVDPNNNTTTFAYDPDGNRTLQTDANGNATYSEYNYKGKPLQVKDALGGITSFSYSETGCPSCGGGVDKLSALMDANGNTTMYFYDLLGRLTQETAPLPTGSDERTSTNYTYDAKGNLISRTDAKGATIHYTYDAAGRLLTKTFPDGSATTFTYDAKGNLLTATNNYDSYTFTYDANGRVTSVTEDNTGTTISYTYNAVGNKTQMIYPDGSTLVYTYDSANRLGSIKDGSKTYQLAYDQTGKRSKLTFPNGISASYTYDLASRLTSLINSSPTGTIIASSSYTLDRVGNRLTNAGLNNGTTYSYDSVYNLLSSQPGNYGPEAYSYDLVGNRLTGPDPSKTYTYDQDNQLVTGNGQQFKYDGNGNLISRVTGSTTISYSYDYENRLIHVVKNDAGTITGADYYYDPFGRRIQVDESLATGMTSTSYVYDGPNIIAEFDNNTGLQTGSYIHGPNIDEPLAVIRGTNSTHYYYHADGLGSVTAMTDDNGTVVQSYSYDSFGNTNQSSTNTASTATVASQVGYYTINDGTQFSRSSSPTSTTVGNGTVSQTVNQDGSVTLNISNSPGYADDGFYLRVGKLGDFNGLQIATSAGSDPVSVNIWFDVDNNGEFFVWNGGVLTSLGNDVYSLGPSSAQNVLTVNANSNFYLIPGGGTYTLAQLQSGAVAGITSSTQIAIWVGIDTGGGSLNATITSIQSSALQNSSFTQPFTFTGREYDPASGLYYYRARYYDASTGRFINKDPIGFRGGDTNLYRYVGNNPVNWIDPWGLVLTNEQIANILFNETRSFSGPNVNDARVNIANAIINGDEALGDNRPITAPTTANVPPAEQQTYQACQDAVTTARNQQANGTDPTNGAMNFNFRNSDSTAPFFGLPLQTQVGPLNNSYTGGGLNNTGVYSNTYGGSK